MAFYLNRGQVIGNVTRDPEVRQTSSGQSVASFSVATNRVWTDGSGQRQEKADFHNIVAWGKLAEIVQQYVKKGRKIYVEGRMQTRDWEGDDGQKRYRSEVVADNLILLDRAGAPAGGGADNFAAPAASAPVAAAPSAAPAAAPAAPKVEEEVAIDDLPF
jgi:single-strand DNA-binding protein